MPTGGKNNFLTLALFALPSVWSNSSSDRLLSHPPWNKERQPKIIRSFRSNQAVSRFLTMQWILFLVGCIALAAAAAARKAQNDVYTLYSFPSEYIHHTPEHHFLSLDRIRDLYRLGTESEESEPKVISKRALSVLSRWRPFGNLGVRMNSIHKTPSRSSVKMSLSSGTDFVSAETRGSTRPLGQPLRWGRKR